MTEVQGYCDEKFEPVREAFTKNFDDGLELGATFAVTLQGKFVCDLYGGYADRKRSRSWRENTIVNTFSTTKVATNICIFMLLDQGKLDLHTPLVEYWPEFKGGGKEKITTFHVMIHSAGLPGLKNSVPFETKFHWEEMIHLLEQEELWFEPGSMQAYHSETYGFLLGEVLRRITGETIGQYFRKYVAEPYDIDFHIGLTDSEDKRVAQLHFDGVRQRPDDTDSIAYKIVTTFIGPGSWETQEARAAEHPSSNGHGNARSVAKMGAILAMGGELEGKRLMSREFLELATQEHARGVDVIRGEEIVRCLGFGLQSGRFEPVVPEAFGWGGYGGSFCAMDMKRGISVSYVPSSLHPGFKSDPKSDRIGDALRPILLSMDA